MQEAATTLQQPGLHNFKGNWHRNEKSPGAVPCPYPSFAKAPAGRSALFLGVVGSLQA